ncbi:hypothetical protein [Pseudoalteromonas rubra]|uniref:hypothetical protein n=1 Tax=Pseudoalteromonas rubra TaxID=43658 RepID=UPI00201674D4|nr:hypothetical protein [Pseudoalteromonas rubra]
MPNQLKLVVVMILLDADQMVRSSDDTLDRVVSASVILLKMGFSCANAYTTSLPLRNSEGCQVQTSSYVTTFNLIAGQTISTNGVTRFDCQALSLSTPTDF